jgi:hypothetical protein
MVFVRTPAFMQTRPDQSFFGLQYLQSNLEQAIWYIYNPDYRYTHSIVLSLFGTIAAVFLLVKGLPALRKGTLSNKAFVLLLVGCVVVANTTLVLCNFWGQLSDPAASRFALPLFLWFALCVAWLLAEWRKTRSVPAWITAAVAFGIASSVASSAEQSATKSLWIGRQYEWLFEKMEEPQHKEALIIAHPSGPILFNRAALSLEEAEANKWKIKECLRLQLYPEILVVEKWIVNYQTGKEEPYSNSRALDLKQEALCGENLTALSASFVKEKVAEYRMGTTVVCRLFRIVDVTGPDSEPPESYTKEGYPFENVLAQMKHIQSALP